MALILSIETSAASCSVALHDHGILIKALEVSEGQAHAEKLARIIQELFEEEKAITELKAVAISSGPGSYTGLRIGTSTAKGICYALNIPLIAIITLDLLADQVIREKSIPSGSLLCPMIDAKRMEVYCQVVNSKLEMINPIEAKIIDETSFSELLKDNNLFFFGDGMKKCKGVIKHPNAYFLDDFFPKAFFMGEMAFSKFEKKQFEDLVNFVPLYLKDFVAKKAHPVF